MTKQKETNDSTETVSKFKFPSEVVKLPSKGLLYPSTSPLSKGEIEMKYMTAREEDILTNQNFIRQGVVLDKLLQSLILTKIDYNDLLIGDKNAIMIAARILGYGKDYNFMYDGEEQTVDLSELESQELDESNLLAPNKNEFKFVLPKSGNEITFKLLTNKDEKDIENELAGIKKINKNLSPELTTRLKYIILSINGDYEKKTIRDFVDNYLLAPDSRALRDYIRKTQPDVITKFKYVNVDGVEEDIEIPITINFFWPDA